MSDIKTKILVFDPGESTGWVARMSDGTLGEVQHQRPLSYSYT